LTKQILSSTSATVYFDNCLVGALVKADHPAEMPALAALMREHVAGRLLLVASTEVLGEIERLPPKYQGPHLEVWKQLRRLPAANVSWIDELRRLGSRQPIRTTSDSEAFCRMKPIGDMSCMLSEAASSTSPPLTDTPY
jgi:hypothetical protein